MSGPSIEGDFQSPHPRCEHDVMNFGKRGAPSSLCSICRSGDKAPRKPLTDVYGVDGIQPPKLAANRVRDWKAVTQEENEEHETNQIYTPEPSYATQSEDAGGEGISREAGQRNPPEDERRFMEDFSYEGERQQ